MKKLITVFSLLLILSASFVLAQGDSDHQDIYIPVPVGGEFEDKQKVIDELEKKVSDLQGQAKTLASQIATYDNQIQLTSLKIAQTEIQIKSITEKIGQLEEKLQEKSKLLEKQILHTYKEGGIDPILLMLSSSDVSEIVSRFKYLQIVQNNNRKFLHDTQVVQANYGQQKDLIAESQKKLQAQQASLTALRVQRDNILKQTKNNEAIYQKQLEQARFELEAIQRAIISGKKEGPVKKGDAIALVGNSGYPSCSTGKHLHFEVRKNDAWVSAETFLKSGPSYDGTTIGSGDWEWPLKGDIRITQRYGKTPWSYVYAYSGGIHTGIDMISTQDAVYAPADGTLYSYTTKCGTSSLNIKYVDHGSDVKTFYLHVQ